MTDEQPEYDDSYDPDWEDDYDKEREYELSEPNYESDYVK